MAKSANQKLKLLYLLRILWEETDEDHGLSMESIIKKLAACGVEAERKSLYDDFSMLGAFGIDVLKQKDGRSVTYSLGTRDFSVGELKLLADAVQSSRFLTQKRSEELIGKLRKMASRHEASLLERQLQVTGSVKMLNESIFISVDRIYSAIANNRMISFLYLEWDEHRKLVPRKDGEKVHISPWALVWDNEFYYLVAYDPAREALRHYRVDKMKHIEIEEHAREGFECFKKADIRSYAEQRFSMYEGEKEAVTVECSRAGFGPFFDRFGEEGLSIRKTGDVFRLRFHVAVTDVFLGWIAGLGEGVRIVAPQSVCDRMAEFSARLLKRHVGGPVRAVIFDLGNVLVDFRYDGYMTDLGFNQDTQDFFRKEIILSPLWCRMDLGELMMPEFSKILCERYPRYEKEIKLFFKEIKGICAEYPDSEKIVSELKGMGYEVYVLSNYPEELYEMHYRDWNFLPLTDGAVISAHEKLAKPDAAIYKLLTERYHLSPEQCVFLDDREDNVAAARASGIRAIRVNHREEAFRTLFEYLAVCGK